MSDWDDSIIEKDPAMLVLNGIVVDAERARVHKCKCVKLASGKVLCWVPGIIGMLSQDQVREFCPEEKRVYIQRERLTTRLERFRQASEICEGLSLLDRIECMHIALKEGFEKAREFAESRRK